MNTKGAAVLGACIIVAALVVALVPRLGAPPAAEVGRFQLVRGDGPGFAIFDTQTGLLQQEVGPRGGVEGTNWNADRPGRLVPPGP
jgi:hypothetical protein